MHLMVEVSCHNHNEIEREHTPVKIYIIIIMTYLMTIKIQNNVDYLYANKMGNGRIITLVLWHAN